ncbi:MAG: hypothetical protein AB2746_17805, partial [Candidatus Thiodiazotropha taylori]
CHVDLWAYALSAGLKVNCQAVWYIINPVARSTLQSAVRRMPFQVQAPVKYICLDVDKGIMAVRLEIEYHDLRSTMVGFTSLITTGE